MNSTKPSQSGREARSSRDWRPSAWSDQGEDPDGQVDVEDPPPGQPGDQRPADDRANGHRDPGERAPDAEGNALVLAAEGVGQKASETENMIAPPMPCKPRETPASAATGRRHTAPRRR